jgi:hypothetical protein
MSGDAESSECLHGMCEACRFEDCSCFCHLPDEEDCSLEYFGEQLDEEEIYEKRLLLSPGKGRKQK